MEPETKSAKNEQPATLKHVDNSQFIGIITAVIVIILTLVLLAIWKYRRNARRGILLLGMCDSGKTLIFSRLIHNRYVQTQTSVKENAGDYIVKSGFLRVIDIPGHERVRSKFFDQFKVVARGIVYVIDSVTYHKEIHDVAEFLYNILSDSVVANNSPPVLILCNKQDQPLAKGSKVIQSYLEKEMNVLRVTKSNQLESTNDSGNTNNILGKKDKDFEFSHLHPLKVEFAESAALTKDSNNPADLDALKLWLNKIA